MDRRYSKEFCDDVVQVALNHDPDVNLAQIARDRDRHAGTLDKGLCQKRVETGAKPDVTCSDIAEPEVFKSTRRVPFP